MREESLLTQVRLLTEKHEALAAANGLGFSLFSILDRETDEVQTHSAILCELLNLAGTHRQGAVFLRAFVKRFVKRFHLDEAEVETARVRREETIAKGSRADILIETSEAMVVIENKIYAPDQPAQLERYHAYADKWAKSEVFYLTLHGEEPSSDSLGALPSEKVTCISYETDVLEWLDDCVKEVARVPQIREILVHYQGLLRKLTGRSTGELTMELKDLLWNEQGGKPNLELVPKIADAMTELSIDAEWTKFWLPLKRELLVEQEGRGWRLTSAEGVEDFTKEVTLEHVRHAHGRGRSKWRYGWTFRIESDNDSSWWLRGDRTEVLLRIECDEGGQGFYGFIATTHTTGGKSLLPRSEHADLFGEWSQRMAATEEEGWYTDAEWWLAWGYPSQLVELWKTQWLAPYVLCGLRDGETVTSLVQDVRSSIDAIEGLHR